VAGLLDILVSVEDMPENFVFSGPRMALNSMLWRWFGGRNIACVSVVDGRISLRVHLFAHGAHALTY